MTQIFQVNGKENFPSTDRQQKTEKMNTRNGAGKLLKTIAALKTITILVKLDASYDEYLTKTIKKVQQAQLQVENLLKKQMSITSIVIKNFDGSIQKVTDSNRIGRTIRLMRK